MLLLIASRPDRLRSQNPLRSEQPYVCMIIPGRPYETTPCLVIALEESGVKGGALNLLASSVAANIRKSDDKNFSRAQYDACWAHTIGISSLQLTFFTLASFSQPVKPPPPPRSITSLKIHGGV